MANVVLTSDLLKVSPFRFSYIRFNEVNGIACQNVDQDREIAVIKEENELCKKWFGVARIKILHTGAFKRSDFSG